MMLSRSMGLLRCWVVSFSLLSANSADASCSSLLKPPVEIPIRNLTVSDQLVRRGAALQVGSLLQNITFGVTLNQAQTFLLDRVASTCHDQTPICAAIEGGFFDTNLSTSWSQAASFESLNTTAEKPDASHDNYTFGTDTMHINSTLSLQDYPIVINPHYDVQFGNIMGLGINSTLLNALSIVGSIASKTWSYFYGWAGVDAQHQIDGSLVLGGYDADKIGGNELTNNFTDDSRCGGGLIVTITDIKMNLKNGSNPTILGPSAGAALKACIDLTFPLIATLPVDIWNEFVAISEVQSPGRSMGVYFWAMMILADGAYDGDLTFTLSPTLDIRIPNHQLVLPDYQQNSQGNDIFTDHSNRVVLIDSLQDVNKDDMPKLGQIFFSSAYLLVNNELETFTISQSNVTENKNLIAIGSQACTDSPPPETLAPTNPLSSGSPSTSSSASQRGTGSKRVIAGAVIGGALSSSLLIGGIILWRKRSVLPWAFGRKDSAMHHTGGTPDIGAHIADTMYLKPELPSDRQPPQEMPLVQDPPPCRAIAELPATESNPTKKR